jgi:quercetin dioxygenase-like cupin family protein
MEAKIYRWADVEEDRPVDRLVRRRIIGEKVLAAQIHLEKGCVVNPHSHPSEQVSIVISGKTRWRLDDDEHEYIASVGDVIVLPGGCRHGCEALEDSDMIDILSPPAAMGVDSQGK